MRAFMKGTRARMEEEVAWARDQLGFELSGEVITATSVADGITEHAVALGADVIVVGTHGHRGFRRLFLGNVADEVVRKASGSVLICPLEPERERSLRRILVAVDLSKVASLVLRSAVSIAKCSGASVTVLSIVEGETTRDGLTLEEAESTLAGLVDGLPKTDVSITPWTLRGVAHEEILAMAEANEVDMIVLGSRGLRGFSQALLGTTAERVMREAACPVLSLRF